jgi:cell fate (sporulation/competence/biofilm development) regulator YlbF (YheA/YmcA/DUF963 family)
VILDLSELIQIPGLCEETGAAAKMQDSCTATVQLLHQRIAQLEEENQRLQVELAQLRLNYQRLEKSEARYRQVVENAPINISFDDAAGTLESDHAAQQDTAQDRVRLLDAIAQVANLLLRSSDYSLVLSDVVRLLGEAVESDRCNIIQELDGSDAIYIRLLTWNLYWYGATLPHFMNSMHGEKLLIF